jgi:hypothetical protein
MSARSDLYNNYIALCSSDVFELVPPYPKPVGLRAGNIFSDTLELIDMVHFSARASADEHVNKHMASPPFWRQDFHAHCSN